MSNNKGWYQLHTVEEIADALNRGFRVEYTSPTFPSDPIDCPASDCEGSYGWIFHGSGWSASSNAACLSGGGRFRAYDPTLSENDKTISPIAYQQYRESLNSAIEDGGLPAWVVSLLEEGRDYLDVLATKNFTFRED